ncbi:MAG: AtpZ/AtpI family protein [Acidobacteriota bacterium]
MEEDEQLNGEPQSEKKEPFIVQNSDFVPDSPDETVRKSGLAWSAGIVFFGSIVFMMFLGWGADLFFGSSPWGLVGGIVLGSILGFIQFFRLSSQIFGDSAAKSRPRSLFDDDNDRAR